MGPASKLGVNSRIVAGLKTGPSGSGTAGVAAKRLYPDQQVCERYLQRTEPLPPNPRGVKAGALAACVVKDGFLPLLGTFAGVNEGDSTFRAFLELYDHSSAGMHIEQRVALSSEATVMSKSRVEAPPCQQCHATSDPGESPQEARQCVHS